MFPVMHGHQTNLLSYAVNVTGGGSNHTKGSYAELAASLPQDMAGIWVGGLSDSSSTLNFLFDFAIGAAGSEKIIVNNFPVNKYGAGRGMAKGIFVPLALPAGTRVSARCQSNTASGAATALFDVVPAGHYFGKTCGVVETCGASTASTRGTQVDPGASANTKGAWSQLIASTANEHKAMALAFCSGLNNLRTSGDWLFDIGIGAAGSEIVLLPNVHLTVHSTPSVIQHTTLPFPVNVPAGTRLSVRAQSSITDATDRLVDAIAFGYS